MKFTNELRGVKSRLLLFSVLLLIPVMMFAQSITVKGTVLDWSFRCGEGKSFQRNHN